MIVRCTFFLLLTCLFAAPVRAVDEPVLKCKRKGFSILYAPPAGWTGPIYAGGPALDSWTFTIGQPEKANTIELRLYDAKDSPLRWDTASEAEIIADLKEGYNAPRVERVATVPINGQRARVRAVHSPGVDEYLANVYFGNTLVSIMYTTNDSTELSHHRAAFVEFLRSLHFEKSH